MPSDSWPVIDSILEQANQGPKKLFEITCTIGAVYAGDNPMGLSPREMAFVLIAQHGADGDFSFPNEDGTINHVMVDTETKKN